MCPDRDLISAYVDGEVPSPWRERLEEHLASCPACSALAASYAELGASLRGPADEGEFQALARGRERLELLLVDIPSSGEREATIREIGASRRLWRHSIRLPLPLAAAAAILVLLLGGATTVLALKPGKNVAIQAIASNEIAPLKVPAQPASMDELLRYLDSSDGQVTLTINLPSGTTFGSAGKPVIMRAPQSGMTVGGRSP